MGSIKVLKDCSSCDSDFVDWQMDEWMTGRDMPWQAKLLVSFSPYDKLGLVIFSMAEAM